MESEEKEIVDGVEEEVPAEVSENQIDTDEAEPVPSPEVEEEETEKADDASE